MIEFLEKYILFFIYYDWNRGYLAASCLCISAICGLSSQPTARTGNYLGMAGVGAGVVTTLLAMNFPYPVLV